MKFYEEKNLVLYLDDTFERLKKFPENYVDIIFADPPYFLSNDGFSVQSVKRVSVNKGEWDRGENFDEKHKFNREWLKLAKKILESKQIKNFEFIWITDGEGWQSAKRNLKETFLILENLYNIKDLENGIFEKIF